MKRRLFAGAVILICLGILTYGTLAYFTADSTAHNVITTGNIDIQLLEWADEAKETPFPEDGVEYVMPGTEITKIVEVANTGANAAYVRVKVTKDIQLSVDTDTEPDLGLMILDFDSTYWTYNAADGYYYYNEALAPGETTQALFASVTFDASMSNIYQNSTAAVDVVAYAVQVANNGDSVFEAAGWPEE